MAELSPAAQAVLDAVTAELDWDARYHSHEAAAAALRAAADQLAQTPIVIGEPLRGNIAKDAAVIHVADLLAIVTELKTSND